MERENQYKGYYICEDCACLMLVAYCSGHPEDMRCECGGVLKRLTDKYGLEYKEWR